VTFDAAVLLPESQQGREEGGGGEKADRTFVHMFVPVKG
jgi:hypothetical protein